MSPWGPGAAVCHIRRAIKDALEITLIPQADGNTLRLEDLRKSLPVSPPLSFFQKDYFEQARLYEYPKPGGKMWRPFRGMNELTAAM